MLNRVILIGRLTRDAELRRTASGLSVASFTVAVDDPRKNPDGTSNTLFMNCTLFGQRADNFVKYTHKGSLVSVEGRLQQRKYVNKAGVNVTVIETLVDNFDFLDPKSANAGTDNATPAGFNQTETASEPESGNLDAIDVTEDDLPF